MSLENQKSDSDVKHDGCYLKIMKIISVTDAEHLKIGWIKFLLKISINYIYLRLTLMIIINIIIEQKITHDSGYEINVLAELHQF